MMLMESMLLGYSFLMITLCFYKKGTQKVKDLQKLQLKKTCY